MNKSRQKDESATEWLKAARLRAEKPEPPKSRTVNNTKSSAYVRG